MSKLRTPAIRRRALLFRYSGVSVSPSMMWEDRALYTSECSPAGKKFSKFWSTRSD